jgi:uncharacterized membrane protein HdeD (DUF308 family)
MSNPNSESTRSGTIVTLAGLLLIVLGVLFLIGQMINVDVERLAWPFFVIVPGILVFFFALGRGDQTGERLAMVGSAVTMVGTILLFQNTFDYFQSWAYAWGVGLPHLCRYRADHLWLDKEPSGRERHRQTASGRRHHHLLGLSGLL